VSLDEHRWSRNLTARLIHRVMTGQGAAVTWYNHASLCASIDGQVNVSRFDFVGVDGMFLRSILAPGTPRTSADLVLPLLLSHLPDCRVALIGSDRPGLDAAAAVIEALPSKPEVVFTCDGYAGLLSPAEMADKLQVVGVDVVVLGLGAPLQDSYLLELRDSGLTRQLLVTCGGWIDQVSQSEYYPPYAYHLKINWLIRLLREPARLWRRYTVQGLAALRRRTELRNHLLVRGARPFDAMVTGCTTGEPTVTHSPSPSYLPA
jgi:UDP-N-acetyl-D-mannosaminuronic acid transferase (WecB/TagA/CpsF family)